MGKCVIDRVGVLGLVAATVALSMGASSSALAAEAGASELQSAWIVDTRGRPPFKRSRTQVPVVDVEAKDAMGDDAGETVVVWQRDTTGKPPFKRRRIEVTMMDAASTALEGQTAPKTNFRGRPPFKRGR